MTAAMLRKDRQRKTDHRKHNYQRKNSRKIGLLHGGYLYFRPSFWPKLHNRQPLRPSLHTSTSTPSIHQPSRLVVSLYPAFYTFAPTPARLSSRAERSKASNLFQSAIFYFHFPIPEFSFARHFATAFRT